MLEAARREVMEAYDNYVDGEAWKLDSSFGDKPVAEALRSNYGLLRSGALKEIGAELLARSSLCCLCALRDSSELDHYLPKEDFPEFAALSLNLVPACSVCNNKKRRDFRNERGEQAFIHAYLDDLPDSLPFLRASLSDAPTVTPSFHVVQPAGMSASLFAVIAQQFELFELDTAYSGASVELLLERRDALEEYFGDGGAADVMKYLDRDARSAARRVGVNHWRPTILAAAAASPDFCSGGFRHL